MTTAPADGPGTAAPPERRTEMDALRALVVVGLVFFHSALVFDTEDDFYVKNDGTVPLAIAAGPIVLWAMPLLFLIAGFGARQSLRHRGPAGFAGERVRRLGVPLLFGLVVLVPFPQWLRARAADPGYDESYVGFYPRFWDVEPDPADFPFVLRGEHFETGHLWFVLLLLTFALLVAIPAALLPDVWRRGAVDRAGATVSGRPALLLVAAVPTALISAVLGLEEALGAWHRWAYLVFFCYGLVVVGDPRFRAAIRRFAGTAGWVAGGLFALSGPGFALADDPFTDMTPLAIACRACFGAAGWCAVVAILGMLDRPHRAAGGPAAAGRPSRTGRVSSYLSPAVLPLYVLHQPVVVAVAYVVVQWELPGVVKYAVIVLVSLAVTVAAYDLLVRRTRPTRFLLGMR